jgi:phosphohistidine phosphatase
MLVLDILRHGYAEPHSSEGDAGRPLTADGAEAIRRLGRQLIAVGWRPTRIFASPFKRTRDTARVLTESLDAPPLIETLMELEPDAEAGEALTALEVHGALDGHVLLVSHMPLVSGICAHLTTEAVGFAPGQIRRIACPQGTYRGTGRSEPVPGGDVGA